MPRRLFHALTERGVGLDQEMAEHFASTINQLEDRVTMLFITHALPKSLVVGETVRTGGQSASLQ
jgi:subfamily B ATP-binding cassette protein HlyB/CyaB